MEDKIFSFKEVNIQKNLKEGSRDEIIENHLEYVFNKISPAIDELLDKDLITYFHFINHNGIDLRLSCDNWEEKEDSIKVILSNNGISTDLKLWEGQVSVDKVDLFVLYCISSTIFIYLKEKGICADCVATRSSLWTHYVYNLFGITNSSESAETFLHSLNQLEVALYKTKAIDNSRLRQYLRWMKLCINRRLVDSWLISFGEKFNIHWPVRLHNKLSLLRNNFRVAKELRREKRK